MAVLIGGDPFEILNVSTVGAILDDFILHMAASDGAVGHLWYAPWITETEIMKEVEDLLADMERGRVLNVVNKPNADGGEV